MAEWIQAHKRLLTSARILKAYYESKLKIGLELLTEPPEPRLDGDVGFHDSVASYGLWGLRPSKPITAETRAEIEETCDTVLVGLDTMESQREALDRLQQQMEGLLNGELPSNVVALRRPFSLASAQPQRAHEKRSLKSDCLIEAADATDIRKMALELHGHSDRMAFLEFCHLDPAHRHSISQLINLGSITIFVPDISRLDPIEQEILRHLIRETPARRPLLMVGSLKPYSELTTSPSVDAELLALLARSYLKLTRPFSEYKAQGLIHYFLDSLSSSPS